MHLHRWITAIVALPFLIYLIWKGGIFFSTLIAGVCILSLWEYFRIIFDSFDSNDSKENPKSRWFLMIVSFGFGTAMIWSAYERGSSSLMLGIISLHLIVCGFFSLTQFESDPVILKNISAQIQGMTYIALSLSFLVLIRQSPEGMIWIFWIICIIFAGDIGAFYTGRSFGRHKLCPSVSPGKTIEGAIGGLLSNILIGSVIKFFFLQHLPLGKSLLFFVCLGIAGQIGDLFESEFKRAAGVKDSGTILPGHGGILDRIDALLFAAPVAFLFKKFILL